MSLESTPQNSPEKTEPKIETTQERAKKLKKLRQALGRFILAGVVFFGGEAIKYHFDEAPPTVAEMFELADQEERDEILGLVYSGRLENPPEILHDIEAKDGTINKETVGHFLNTLPQNWVDGEISVVANVEKGDYIPAALWSGFVATFSFKGKELEFQDGAKEVSVSYLFYALGHETGHANDFFVDSNLSWPERHHLYQAILSRLNGGHHFRTRYLETLKTSLAEDEKNTAPRLILVQEYWAEICAQYFSDPYQLEVEDFQLVHSYVLKNDPDYNWMEKLKERQSIAGTSPVEHIVAE